MNRLVAYDFDGTLIDSPEPNPGKDVWLKKKGEPYPHQGWWGRKESLDTEVFDIKPFPNILKKLRDDVAAPNTHVIILTSRREKLRPQMENVLKLNNIHVDEVIMKRGNEGKGEVLLNYLKNNPKLKEIVLYDDFAGGVEDKIKEATVIRDQIPEDVDYHIYNIVNGKLDRMLESTNILKFMISDEVLKFKK